MTDRLAAYLAATEPKPRGPSPEARALANRRRVAANLAAVLWDSEAGQLVARD